MKCGKPLIVHSRDAEAETLQILKDNLPAEWRIHIHCFCDTAEHAALLLNTFPNLYIGVTGSLTFTSSSMSFSLLLELTLCSRCSPRDNQEYRSSQSNFIRD